MIKASEPFSSARTATQASERPVIAVASDITSFWGSPITPTQVAIDILTHDLPGTIKIRGNYQQWYSHFSIIMEDTQLGHMAIAIFEPDNRRVTFDHWHMTERNQSYMHALTANLLALISVSGTDIIQSDFEGADIRNLSRLGFIAPQDAWNDANSEWNALKNTIAQKALDMRQSNDVTDDGFKAILKALNSPDPRAMWDIMHLDTSINGIPMSLHFGDYPQRLKGAMLDLRNADQMEHARNAINTVHPGRYDKLMQYASDVARKAPPCQPLVQPKTTTDKPASPHA